ncbi:DUF5753 domain-containing protein [Kitasatospora acidiphila]|nr:DUF5753 domain-containing protein [Kitasatospora acidiphila]
MSEAIDPKSSLAALFADRARRARARRGMTQVQSGRELHTAGSRVNQIERMTGSKPTLPLARAMDQTYDTDELFEDLWYHVDREQYPDYVQAFMSYEAKAVDIREFTGFVIPGLLQTRAYARAVLHAAQLPHAKHNVEALLAARMSRQKLILRPNGTKWEVVLDEAVIMREVGGPQVMRAQLARILRAAERPNITVQVLPFNAGEHYAMGASLTLHTLANGNRVAYIEGSRRGQIYDDPAQVRHCTEVYDDLRAKALPPIMSLDMIRSVLEGIYRDPRLP